MKVPVIIVGNVSVGGNGKTPLVIWLARYLTNQGYRPGVLSRGYGGHAGEYPRAVQADDDPRVVGDEPTLMAARLNCPVVIDPIRVRGARCLQDHYQCDLIICDDGLQHYALCRDIEIAVFDGMRRHGNQRLLPVGPLREPLSRLNKVDLIVNNGGQAGDNEYLMKLVPGQVVNLLNGELKTEYLFQQSVTAVAGIGNPDRFFKMAKNCGVNLNQCLAFDDHHPFKLSDLPAGTVLMTEKDAVKCRAFAQPDWWYIPVEAELDDSFGLALISCLNAQLTKECPSGKDGH
jgi:tetraacyldisaccharide 4'-kinase